MQIVLLVFELLIAICLGVYALSVVLRYFVNFVVVLVQMDHNKYSLKKIKTIRLILSGMRAPVKRRDKILSCFASAMCRYDRLDEENEYLNWVEYYKYLSYLFGAKRVFPINFVTRICLENCEKGYSCGFYKDYMDERIRRVVDDYRFAVTKEEIKRLVNIVVLTKIDKDDYNGIVFNSGSMFMRRLFQRITNKFNAIGLFRRDSTT